MITLASEDAERIALADVATAADVLEIDPAALALILIGALSNDR